MSAVEPRRFEVRLPSRRVQRELDGVRVPDYRRVLGVLYALSQEPRPLGCEKLYDDVFRIRVGRWRIIYLVDQVHHRVEVGAIRRRSERTYRGVEDLFT